jgi:RNA polymerase sigma factor (sigma-70 family)
VCLRFVGDLSQTEIAQRLHISQSQASRLLAGALEKLRSELAPKVDRAA